MKAECYCALAGTNACENCSNNGYYRDGFGNTFKIVIDSLDSDGELTDYRQEFEDCRSELCAKCKSQSIFDSEWCKECRWNKE